MNEEINDDLLDDLDVIIMKDEDDNEIPFVIIDALRYKDSTYILAVPMEEGKDVDEVEEAIIFKEVGTNEDESIFDIVDDDAEFVELAKLFSENDDFEVSIKEDEE
ncbi:MAG: DUF1292 domain-containing protein [Lachnospirales bacterium]